jgi:hypothetical protein
VNIASTGTAIKKPNPTLKRRLRILCGAFLLLYAPGFTVEKSLSALKNKNSNKEPWRVFSGYEEVPI